MKTSVKGDLILVFITAIWGLTFPLIRNAVSTIDPFSFVFIRFSLAALLLIPLALFTIRKTSLTLFLGCLLLGLMDAGAYTLQTAGLQTINAGRSAFITGLSVVLVPFVAKIFKLNHLKKMDIYSAALCVIGLYVLTGANLQHLMIGDLWTLLAAILFAFTIVYLQYLSLKFAEHNLLVFYQILLTIPFVGLFIHPISLPLILAPKVLIATFYCSFFATALAFYLQTKYQKLTTAPQAALIYSLEPVFAMIFDFFINGEKITPHMIIGGGVVLLSLALTPLLLSSRPERSGIV